MKPEILNVVHSDHKALSKVEGATGKVYKKQIIAFGDYVDPMFPEWPMTLDKVWGERIVENFNRKVVGRVAVPATHTDDPEKNRGELIGVELNDLGIDGILDIRDPDTVEKIESGLIWDDSISFTNNYIDEKGIGWGPVLFHVALVNNPYITQMGPFQALSRVVNDLRYAFAKSHTGSAIMLSKQVKDLSSMNTKSVKNEREFAVEVTYLDTEGKEVKQTVEAGAEIEVPVAVADGVTQQFTAAEAPKAEETEEAKAKREAEEKAAAEKAEADKKVAEDKEKEEAGKPTVTPEGELDETERAELSRYREQDAERAFTSLSKAGKILPAQKAEVVAFAKKHGASALEDLYKNAKPVVDFSEKGSQTSTKTEQVTEDVKPGIKKYANLSQAEQDNLKVLKVSPEQYDRVAEANPEYYKA